MYIINISTFFFKPCKIVGEFGCHRQKARSLPKVEGVAPLWRGVSLRLETDAKVREATAAGRPQPVFLTSCILEGILHPFLRIFLSSSVVTVWLE